MNHKDILDYKDECLEKGCRNKGRIIGLN